MISHWSPWQKFWTHGILNELKSNDDIWNKNDWPSFPINCSFLCHPLSFLFGWVMSWLYLFIIHIPSIILNFFPPPMWLPFHSAIILFTIRLEIRSSNIVTKLFQILNQYTRVHGRSLVTLSCSTSLNSFSITSIIHKLLVNVFLSFSNIITFFFFFYI